MPSNYQDMGVLVVLVTTVVTAATVYLRLFVSTKMSTTMKLLIDQVEKVYMRREVVDTKLSTIVELADAKLNTVVTKVDAVADRVETIERKMNGGDRRRRRGT